MVRRHIKKHHKSIDTTIAGVDNAIDAYGGGNIRIRRKPKSGMFNVRRTW